jgi:hypothetical protein
MVMADKPLLYKLEHASSVAVNLQDAGYMPRYKHQTLLSATTEAERLARAHPDTGFFVLEAHSMAKLNTVVWSKPEDLGMPF